MADRRQIVYLPFINLQETEEIDLGFVKIWNFDKKAQDYITDKKLRDKVTRLLATNVLSHNRKPDGIGIIQFSGKKNFELLSDEEMAQIDEIRALLFLAFMSKNASLGRGPNAGHYMATSENFIITIQNFEIDGDFIGERSGFIVNFNIGDYKIEEYKFHAPSYLPTPMRFLYDKRFLSELLKLRSRQKKLYKRILKSTLLMIESYYNDPQVSHNARIMLQCGAFEALLDLPETDQRKVFKEIVERETVDSGEKNFVYWYETRRGNVRDKKPLKVIWADRFYTLRNHIIHGNYINSSEFNFKDKQGHLHIAFLFHILLVKKLINSKSSKKLFYDIIAWKKVNDDFHPYEGFDYDDRELEYQFNAGLLGKITS